MPKLKYESSTERECPESTQFSSSWVSANCHVGFIFLNCYKNPQGFRNLEGFMRVSQIQPFFNTLYFNFLIVHIFEIRLIIEPSHHSFAV